MKPITITAFLLSAALGGLACSVGGDLDHETPQPPVTTQPQREQQDQEPEPDQDQEPEQDQEPDRSAGQPMVTEFGIGQFTVGEVSSGAVERDSGVLLDLRPVTDTCSWAHDDDNGVGVITDHNTLVLAFIVTSPDHRTYGDVGVGSTVEEVLAQFGDAATSLDSGIRIAPPGGRGENTRGMFFEYQDGRVGQYRVGLWPWVENPQFC